MRTDELLVLNYRNFSARTGALYEELSKSAAARKLFINNPTGLFAKSLFSEYNLTSGEINQGNRLLYSLLSNRKFIKWSKEFEAEIRARLKEVEEEEDSSERLRILLATFDRSELYKKIAGAVLQYGDIEIIYSLLVKDPHDIVRRPVEIESVLISPGGFDPLGCELADVAVDIETFVYAVAAVAVFVVAVIVFGVMPSSVQDTLTREDLSRVTSFMSVQLIEKANVVKDMGLLTSIEGTMMGQGL